MKVIDSCVQCLKRVQSNRIKDLGSAEERETYLSEVNRILSERKEDDSAPYMVYLFNKEFVRLFGDLKDFTPIKKEYNDLVLSMKEDLKQKISESDDPLKCAFLYARLGNYIDFGAMNHVDKEEFLKLFDRTKDEEPEPLVYERFLTQCAAADHFLLLADNCGEIVLDGLFLEELKKRFPKMTLSVMVRGEEVLNDVTIEDAVYCGIDQLANVVSTGNGVAGVVPSMLSSEAMEILEKADVILSKGQGNFETIGGGKYHIFYSFLCKCDLFVNRFAVPRLTGMFIEENGI